MPASVHSRSRSGGLSDSMNSRAVSAPYASIVAVGSTVLRRDLLIFSERPTVTSLPSSISRQTPSGSSSTSSGWRQSPAASRKVLWQTMPWVNRPVNGSSKPR